MTSQTVSGKAFEFGIAAEFARAYDCRIVDDAPFRKALESFESRPPREKEMIEKIARRSVDFLLESDVNLAPRTGEWQVCLQPDSAGMQGDVRDIVVKTPSGLELGVSAKNRNDAVKHSRLSDRIDFGQEWAGTPCPSSYFECGQALFAELRKARSENKLWRDIDIEKYRLPLLKCFQKAFEAVCARQGAATRLAGYLLGRKDYYKIIKVNGSVYLQSFNIHGNLGWGNRFRLPQRLVGATIDANAKGTLYAFFSDGWTISFRLHHAESKVTPSMKFDVRLIGIPVKMSNYHLHIGGL